MTIVEALICPHCHQPIWSRHRHDMRFCFCGYCFIDGGRDYIRGGYGGDEWPTPWPIPISGHIDTELGEVTDDDTTV